MPKANLVRITAEFTIKNGRARARDLEEFARGRFPRPAVYDLHSYAEATPHRLVSIHEWDCLFFPQVMGQIRELHDDLRRAGFEVLRERIWYPVLQSLAFLRQSSTEKLYCFLRGQVVAPETILDEVVEVCRRNGISLDWDVNLDPRSKSRFGAWHISREFSRSGNIFNAQAEFSVILTELGQCGARVHQHLQLYYVVKDTENG
ncbi:MAG: hypothetical protein UW86_C0007G0003 [Microgenomates group bacterium GW2011_GWA1_Microgenomates_45_10]|nr:MAG: hypothetical protein UW86_C0007G0003 [Microgenomates group bacterium GW2011_GWA1_Microgenomates_45_10]